MNSSSIITPDQFRNPSFDRPGLAARRPPSLDELIDSFTAGLTAAAEKDLSQLPALLVYEELGTQLEVLGMPSAIVAKTLPKIKVGVPEAFVRHPKYKEFVRLFAVMVNKLYQAINGKFGIDGDPLFLAMVEDRFALVIPTGE